MSELWLHGISKEWLNIIYSGETKKKLDNIYNTLKSTKNITPSKEDLFNWCRITKLDDIHVVILGQDPYHKKGWAHGLSFSCLNNTPPSLKNIYKCLLKTNCIVEMPDHGNLTSWAEQGVLLLNASLSTTIGTAGAHMKVWSSYVKLVIQRICDYHYDNDNQLIFLLWGAFAQDFINIIDADYHICLNAVHPSPLAQRVAAEKKFINCDHFTYVNEFLTADELPKINWKPQEKNINECKKETISAVDQPKVFNDAESIFGISIKKHIAFTDGSCFPNNKSAVSRGGYSSVFVSGPYKNKCVYGNLDVSIENASNIRAEGMAIIRTLELIRDCVEPWNKCDIITDCELWVKMIENYMPKWNSDKFKEKANPDLTLRLWLVYNEVKELGEINLIHMRSHGKDGWQKCADGSYNKFCFEQNDFADKMCSYARTKLEPAKEIFENVVYK